MAMYTLKGRRALVVEDERVIIVLIEDTLADLGCTVTETASRLDEAVAKAGTAAVDLALVGALRGLEHGVVFVALH